ncbi:MAG TPA: hypothetical protein VGK17_02970 [Propionicimonas sp.]|jgi:hypothetical protein
MAGEVVTVTGTERWREEGAHLLGVDKPIQLALRRELRAIGKPVGLQILEAYGHDMPHKGGLAARILNRGRVSILTDLKRGVRVQLSNSDGMFMEQFEDGSIRKPIPWIPKRGNPNVKHPWRPQSVPKGVGMKSFQAQAESLRKRVLETLTQTIKENT